MTTFFGGPGFGGAATQPPSREAQALKGIDSRSKPFVNKDFTKNIQWLNQSVDTLSIYTQKLQQGVDAANQNALEQIQGFIADLIVIFAGGMPTGINLGDLQYIFQAIGALLGVNPDTVFPLNLVEAVGNLFQQFIVPLPQFTDVIFDSIIAWSAEFGLSDEAIAAAREFNDAIIEFYLATNAFTSNIIPTLNRILKQIGLGLGWIDLGLLKQLVGELQAKLQQLLSGPQEFLLNALSLLIVTLFKALTWLVRLINPNNILGALGFQAFGPDVAPPISAETVVWQVGSNDNTQWVYDSVVMYQDSGTFRTKGNAYGKRILTQGTESCIPGTSFALSGWLLWNSVPLGQNAFGPIITFYAGMNEVSSVTIDAPFDREISGGWEQVGAKVIVPNDVDGYRIGYRCATSVSDGMIWAGPLSCTSVEVKLDFSSIFNFVPWDIFKGLPELGDLSVAGVREWLKTLLTEWSPLSAQNLVGMIPAKLLSLIPIGSIVGVQPNLLANPGFDTLSSLQGQNTWKWDASFGHARFGSAYTDCDGTNRELFNANIIPVAKGQKFTFQIWTYWQGLVGGASNPIRLGVNEFEDELAQVPKAGGVKDLDSKGSFGASSNWVLMQANYTVPDGVSSLKFRTEVKESATAGRVHVDDGSAKIYSLLQWSMIDQLESSWNGLLSILSGFNVSLGEGLAGLQAAFNNITARLKNLLPATGLFDSAWLTNILNIPQLSDLSVPGVLNIVDNVVNSIFGWTGFGWSHGQSAQALESLREQQLSNAAALQLFMNTMYGGVSDNFQRVANNLGGNWSESYTAGNGGMRTNGSVAYWGEAFPNGNRDGAFIWQGTQHFSTTDYQKVGIVLASAVEIGPLGLDFGHNDVIVRYAPNNYVRWRIQGNGGWQLVYFIGGQQHVVATGWLPYTPAAGSFAHVFAGDIDAQLPRLYRCYLGPDLIFQWNDTVSQLSAVGPGFRGWGFGARAESPVLATYQRKPAHVAQWIASDQQATV